jgi:hypothetical protein
MLGVTALEWSVAKQIATGGLNQVLGFTKHYVYKYRKDNDLI